MANIGAFKKSGNEHHGDIMTLSVQARVSASSPRSIGPTTRRPATGSSSAALSLKLDDPSFTAPIFANLLDDPDGES